jgi:hypothetical protein
MAVKKPVEAAKAVEAVTPVEARALMSTYDRYDAPIPILLTVHADGLDVLDALEAHRAELKEKICAKSGAECDVRFGVYPCKPMLFHFGFIFPLVAAVFHCCCLAGCIYLCCRRCGACRPCARRARPRIVAGTIVQNPLSEGLVAPSAPAAPATTPSAPAAPAAPTPSAPAAAYPPLAASAYPSLEEALPPPPTNRM